MRWNDVSCLGFFFDVDLDFGGDVAENLDGYREFAEGLDGVGKLDLALVNAEPLGLETLRDIAGGDGAEHLVVLAGLAGELERNAVEQFGLLLCGVQFRGS